MALTHFLPEDSYYHGILAATELTAPTPETISEFG